MFGSWQWKKAGGDTVGWEHGNSKKSAGVRSRQGKQEICKETPQKECRANVQKLGHHWAVSKAGRSGKQEENNKHMKKKPWGPAGSFPFSSDLCSSGPKKNACYVRSVLLFWKGRPFPRPYCVTEPIAVGGFFWSGPTLCSWHVWAGIFRADGQYNTGVSLDSIWLCFLHSLFGVRWA